MIREFNLKIDWVLVFLLTLPTFYIAGTDLRSSQAIFFQYAAILLLAAMHVNKWLGGFLAWCTFQTIFFKSVQPGGQALHYLFYGLMIYQIIVFFSKSNETKKYAKAILFVLLFNVGWCFLQMKQIDPVMQMTDFQIQSKFSEYSGFFALPAFLGNYAAAALPLSFIVSYWFIPAFLIALFFSKSSFSIISAYLAVLFFFWFKSRRAFWILLAVTTAVSAFYVINFDMPTGQFERRAKIWRLIVNIAAKNQFLGTGLGTYKNVVFGETEPRHRTIATNDPAFLKNFLTKEAFDNQKEDLGKHLQSMSAENFVISNVRVELVKNGIDFKQWSNAHNEYLEAFYETGIIGLIFIFGYIYDTFRRFWESGRKNIQCVALMASFIAILVVSFGHFPFHVARLAGPFLVIMALLEVSLIESRKVSQEAW